MIGPLIAIDIININFFVGDYDSWCQKQQCKLSDFLNIWLEINITPFLSIFFPIVI